MRVAVLHTGAFSVDETDDSKMSKSFLRDSDDLEPGLIVCLLPCNG